MSGKRMKLGSKLFGGFSIVLALGVLLAFVGYYGLRGVVDRVDKSERVTNLAGNIEDARMQEKNFIIRHEEKHVTALDEKTKNAIGQAQSIQNLFTQKKYKDQMQQVANEVSTYAKSFHSYADLDKQNITILDEMKVAADSAFQKIEGIRESQESQLIQAQTESEAFLRDKIGKSESAGRIITLFTDIRKTEKQYIISNGAKKWEDDVKKGISEILAEVENLKSGFKDEESKEQLEESIKSIGVYSTAFNSFIEFTKNKQKTLVDMNTKAKAAFGKLETIQSEQNMLLELSRKNVERITQDKQTLAKRANDLILLVTRAEGLRRLLIVDVGNPQLLVDWRSLNTKIIGMLREFKRSLETVDNIQLADSILKAYKKYEKSMLEYMAMETKEEKNKLVEVARFVVSEIEKLRDDQNRQVVEAKAAVEDFIMDKKAKASDANQLHKWFTNITQYEKEYIISNGALTWRDEMRDSLTDIYTLAEDLRSRFPDEEGQAKIDQALEAIYGYDDEFDKYSKLLQEQDATMLAMRAKARQTMDQMTAIQEAQKQELTEAMQANMAFIQDKIVKSNDANVLIKAFMETRQNEKEFIISHGEQQWKDAIEKQIKEIIALSQALKDRFKTDENKQLIDDAMASVTGYQQNFIRYADIMTQQEDAQRVMVAAALKAKEANTAAVAGQKSEILHERGIAEKLLGLVTLIALVAGILLAWFITRSITKPLNRVILGLTDASDQVSSGSDQVSQSSQFLAEGASEQAASIEETSSSLEEMSSMTKQNAQNAGQANTLMQETKKVVGTANESMENLTGSMQEIAKASDETSKIIKTIDEIAFQTNLLALNAAVEAARAGEAGAGFAVVADEVRNLAMRAAEAAKTTSDLIAGTGKKVKDGTELVVRTSDAFREVSESSARVADLVSEIAAASEEQAQGIDEVNRAVTEMDKVTQRNASSAEESASASQQMNAQAELLKGMVHDLTSIVGNRANTEQASAMLEEEVVDNEENSMITSSSEKKSVPPSEKKSVSAAANEVSPHQVIPFEDDDYKDF